MRASVAVIAYGAFVAYVPLAVGVVIWTVLLKRRKSNGAGVAVARAE
jgi:preprotein translocase subunit SecG